MPMKLQVFKEFGVAEVVDHNESTCVYTLGELLPELLGGIVSCSSGITLDLLVSPGVAVVCRGDELLVVMRVPRGEYKMYHIKNRPRRMVQSESKPKPYRLLLPPTLWVVRFAGLNKPKYEKSWFFCTPSLITSLDDTVPLYAFPFGNVYNQGKVCWGNVPMGDLTLSNVGTIHGRLWGSLFNGDLRQDVRMNDGRSFNLSTWYYNAKLSGKPPKEIPVFDGRTPAYSSISSFLQRDLEVT